MTSKPLAVQHQAAVGAAEEDAVVVAVELQAVPLSHRVGQRALGEFVNDLERVGRVAVVVGGEDARRWWRPIFGPLAFERPEDDVVEMHAPVAHHAAGVIEEPAEEQVEPIGVERPLGRGAEPAVVIDVRGGLAVGILAPSRPG